MFCKEIEDSSFTDIFDDFSKKITKANTWRNHLFLIKKMFSKPRNLTRNIEQTNMRSEIFKCNLGVLADVFIYVSLIVK